MAEIGNNPSLTTSELETLGMIVSKISARLAQIMTKYPPKRFFRIAIEASTSRRATLMIRLLTEFTGGSNAINHSNNQENLKELLRQIAESEIFDESDIISSWDNKPHTLSTKEETAILRSLMERGIVENIIGKKQISETMGLKVKETGGYPSAYRLTKESAQISQLLSKKEAIEFIVGSLSKSKLLFIFYWYLFSSLFYLLRDYGDEGVSKLITMGKKLIPNYQEPKFFGDERLRSALSSIDDQSILQLTKQLTEVVTKAEGLDTWNKFLLIGSLLKLNRSID